MTIFKVAYEPGFSQKVRKIIAENVVPSMVAQDEYGAQYCMDSVDDVLDGMNLSDRDEQILKELDENKVDYIEMT